MGRYVVHLQNKEGLGARNAKELLLRARTLVQDAIIRDARISSRYIEFDITVEQDRFQPLLEKLSAIAPVARFTEVIDRSVGKDQAISDAKSLFNEERYWECHEVLEGVWKQAAGNEKMLLQGIILTCAGFVHSQKDEDEICLSVLKRAMPKLKAMDGVYHGIDAESFRQTVEGMLSSKKIRYFKI